MTRKLVLAFIVRVACLKTAITSHGSNKWLSAEWYTLLLTYTSLMGHSNNKPRNFIVHSRGFTIVSVLRETLVHNVVNSFNISINQGQKQRGRFKW